MRFELDFSERGAPAFVRVGTTEAEDHVVEDARPRQQPRVLKRDGAPRGNRRAAVEAGVEPGQRTQQRALAAPTASEQGEELPFVQF